MAHDEEKEVILSVRGLKKYFPVKSPSLIPGRKKYLHAVDGVDFDIRRGETLGLVGESGCGKSTVGRMLVGIEQPTAGTVVYQGRDLVRMKQGEIGSIRTQLQMIFQDSYASLNPRKRVYDILADPMRYHGLVTRETAGKRVNELLSMVGLPQNAARRYPHEFSGGQRQRIGIARALILQPKMIVCDEPVSALDVSVQAQILNLLQELQEIFDFTYILIAHGLNVVEHMSDRIGVMYLGKMVEVAPAGSLFNSPRHPYTEALVSAIPQPDLHSGRKRILLSGEIPSPSNPPPGCRFSTRCRYAKVICREQEPILAEDQGWSVACHFPLA